MRLRVLLPQKYRPKLYVKPSYASFIGNSVKYSNTPSVTNDSNNF